jgi:LDH2 family malate/lactate/ureidoglycolate dehydrogenase
MTAGAVASSPSRQPHDGAVLRWTDVVVTSGQRGSEKVLLGPADLVVGVGETVWLRIPDDEARHAVVDLLSGSRRPVYGKITGRMRRQPGPDPARFLAGDGAGTVIVAAGAAPAGSADRALVLRHGALVADRVARRWPVAEVERRAIDALVGVGAEEAEARTVAHVLVDADVRGHHSHGVELLPMYLDRVRAGGIRPRSAPRWLQRGPVVSVLSAGGGFGQPAALLAARTCAANARTSGLAAVGLRDNNHVGMLAAYRQPFIDDGVVALILNISGPSVAPPGATSAALGNDAVCVIAPRRHGPAVIADFATGAVASGKIRDAAAHGRPVPDGWLLDASGTPTTDPEQLDRGGAVPVFGGTATAHKGLCVTVLVEVLAGMLAGATVSPLVRKQRQHPESVMGCSQLFLGFDADAFLAGDLDALTEALMGAVADSYAHARPDVWFPEQQEQARTAESASGGIPLPNSVVELLGLDAAR